MFKDLLIRELGVHVDTKSHLLLDNLNIHQSESLVRWVAEREGMDQETLGVKGKSYLSLSVLQRCSERLNP
jgi:hypothetical protein